MDYIGTMKLHYSLLVFTGMLVIGCDQGAQKTGAIAEQAINTKSDTLPVEKVALKETFQEADTVYNEYRVERLKPIRENFKRINSIAKWTSTDTIELEESTEGGEAIFYYSNGNLEKIIARHYGETFQQLTEYYLLNGQLSFVFDKTLKYNRPITYDSASMKENKDDQTFDMKKSTIEEDRSYFEKGKLIHQVNNQDCGSSFADDYLLGEQKRILPYFDQLRKLHGK
jgi:hypothetical protein